MARKTTTTKARTHRNGAVTPSPVRRTWPRVLRRPLTAAIVTVLSSGAALAAQPNHIVTDVRTNTRLVVQGNHTDIRTSTVHGTSAFNSFSDFKVGAGQQVDMHLPQHTQNLINLVSDSQAVINGSLNSRLHSGQIGGHVFFADPHGLVVGSQGVLNVGALTVSTPTPKFMQSLLSADGVVNAGALDQLLHGTEPVSADGTVSIKGQVHAFNGVHIRAHSVDAAGVVWVAGNAAASAGAGVNVADAAQGSGLVEHNGEISIVAAGDVSVAGTLRSDSTTARAGSINVTAGGNVNLADTARMNVDGQGTDANGGTIHVWADHDTTVAGGAHLSARGGATGDGGAIEVSAAQTETLNGGTFDASAAHGANGTVLFDPDNVTIASAVYTPTGASYQADQSITVTSTGIINTRQVAPGDDMFTGVSTGNSGDITLKAPTITIDAGGILDASANKGFHAGTVTLEATSSDTVYMGVPTADSEIAVNGTIKGGDVVLSASATAAADYTDPNQAMLSGSGLSAKDQAAIGIGQQSLPFIGVAWAEGTAKVNVGNGADIEAAGNFSAVAHTVVTGKTSAFTGISAPKFPVPAIVISKVTGRTSAVIADGASVSAGGDLIVKATSANTVSNQSTVIGDRQGQAGLTVMVGLADVHTTASIEAGARIGHADNVAVLAHNQNSFTLQSSQTLANKANGGLNLAIGLFDTSATATTGADLGSASDPIRSLTVNATSYTSKSDVGVATYSGYWSTPGQVLVNIVGNGGADLGASALYFMSNAYSGTPADSLLPSGDPLRISATVAVTSSKQSATARIDDGSTVNAAGDVTVRAHTVSKGARTGAVAESAGLAATDNLDGSQNTQVDYTMSGAVAVGLYKNVAEAEIGKNVAINAARIGVGSDVEMPWNVQDVTQFSNVIGEITHIFDDLVSTGTPLTTGYARALSETGHGVGAAAAFNLISVDNTSRAWVGDGSKLTSTLSTDDPWSTHTMLIDKPGDDNDITDDGDWSSTIDIAAHTSLQTITTAGNLQLLRLNGTTGEGDASSAGGAVSLMFADNSTFAGVGAGATLVAPHVGVRADTNDQLIVVAPTAGRGSGLSGNVIFGMGNVDDTTHASINGSANVTADIVTVKAHEGLGGWTIAGAVSQGKAVGVGVGIGVNDFTTHTTAWIGDNQDDSPDDVAADGTSPAEIGGVITTDDLDVQALTDGRSGAFGVAGALQDADKDGSAKIANYAEESGYKTARNALSIGDAGKSPIASALSIVPAAYTAYKWRNKTRLSKSAPANEPAEPAEQAPQVPAYGLAVSGSISVNQASLDTHAYVSGVTIEKKTDAANITVDAINQTNLISASGAAALSAAANPTEKYNAGFAGALAYSGINNETKAWLADDTVHDAGNVAVRALSGGSIASVGLGFASKASTPGSDNTSVAGSFSINQIGNSTTAKITGSDLTASTTAPGDLDVVAYDHTNIGAGGGTFAEGGNTGAGVAVTVAAVSNTVSAALVGGTITGFSNVAVDALTAARIISLAASGTYTPDNTALEGAFTVNVIDNATSAYIGDDAADPTTVKGIGGDVTVKAAGTEPIGTYENLLSADGASDPSDALVDFSGKGLPEDTGLGLGTSIVGVAGALGVGATSAGMSLAYNQISDGFHATIANATVLADGGVGVQAIDDTRIIGLALGLGWAGGGFAGLGSVVVNIIDDDISARIGSDTAGATGSSVTAGSVLVNADNQSSIVGAAGAVAISPTAKGSAAGIAFAYNQIDTQANAEVAQSTLNQANTDGNASHVDGCGADDGANVAIQACATGSINAHAIALEASKGTGGAGAMTVNINNGGTTARAYSSNLTNAENAVSISAAARPSIVSSADSAGVNVTGATGAVAVAVNTLDATVHAEVNGGTYRVGDLRLDASSGNPNRDGSANIKTVALGIAGGSGAADGGAANPGGDAADPGGDAANPGGDAANPGGDAANPANDVANAANGARGAADEVGNVADGARGAANEVGNAEINDRANAGINDGANAGIDDGANAGIDDGANAGIDDGANAGINGGAGIPDQVANVADQVADVVDAEVEAANAAVDAAGDAADAAGGAAGGAADAAGGAAGGGAGPSTFGVAAGSVAININTGDVTADITGGADVVATNNVGVQANNAQGIEVLAGSAGLALGAKGRGVGLVVNDIQGTTQAYIDGINTKVSALAGSTNGLSVAGGKLRQPMGPNAVHGPDEYTAPDMSENLVTVTGLAVNAASTQHVATLGVSAGAAVGKGNAGGAGSATIDVSVLGGNATARIAGAVINQADGANARQQVSVIASHHAVGANFVLGVAGSFGGGAGAGAIGVNTFDGTTDAHITAATVSSRGATTIAARASQRSAGFVAGLAAATKTSGAGSVLVNVTKDHTTAYAVGGSLAARDLSVTANDSADSGLTGGQLSVSWDGAAVGATVVVNVGQAHTSAYIGDDATSTALHVSHNLDVEADSHATAEGVAVSGALSGDLAIAGMVAVYEFGNHVNAYLDHVQLNQDAGEAGTAAVTVKAAEDVDVAPKAAAVALSGTVGFGAAVNVATLHDQVLASIHNSDINAHDGAVEVTADSTRTVNVTTVSGALGGAAGISGAVGLVLFGHGSLPYDDAQNTDADGNASTQQGEPGGELKKGDDATVATIAGSQVDTGSLTVHAVNHVNVTNIVGNLAVGKWAGIGGAVAYSHVYDIVGAHIDGASHIEVTGPVTVRAEMDRGNDADNPEGAGLNTVKTKAYAGAAGAVGLGAAVAIGQVDNRIDASVGGTLTQSGGKDLVIDASDNTAITSDAGQGVAGLGAAGVVVVEGSKTSHVNASVGNTASVTNFRAITLTAANSGKLDITATGVTAGVVAGNAAVAKAEDGAVVTSAIGDGATVGAGTGGITLDATDAPDTSAHAIGVSVGAGAVGASVAIAKVDSTVNATVGDNAKVWGTSENALRLDASATPDGTAARAEADGGAGGTVLALNAAVAEAQNNASVTASTGDNVWLPAGAVSLVASNATNQYATATGMSVSGVLSLGASVATASSDTTTTAAIGASNTGADTRLGGLTITATGTDTNHADTTAGSGGMVSGQAAVSTTDATSNVNAAIGAGTALRAGQVSLTANHLGTYAGTVNAVGAGLVEASGAEADNTADSNVTASIGDGTQIFAAGDFAVTTNNRFTSNNDDVAVQGGSGGVITGDNSKNIVTLTGTSKVDIGNNTTLVAGLDKNLAKALIADHDGYLATSGSDPFASRANLLITASSSLTANDTVALDSGNLVGGGGVSSTMHATLDNAVNVGDDNALSASGALGMGTFTTTNATQTALIHTYGLATGGIAHARTNVSTDQDVILGQRNTLLAFGDINLTAGKDATGLLQTSLRGDAVASAYSYAALAFPEGHAYTEMTSTGNVTLGADSNVLSARDIDFGAYTGTPTALAYGAAHGYFLGVIPSTRHDSNPSSVHTGSVTLDGTLVAGIFHDNEVDIDAAGNLTHPHGAPLLYQHDAAFRPHDYITQYTTGLEDNNDQGVASVANTLTGTTTAGPTPAYELGTLVASGGDVTLHADSILGNGAATAHGSPQVTVNNASNNYLVVGPMAVAGDGTEGKVRIVGDAALVGNVTITQDTAPAMPTVAIANTFNGVVKGGTETITQGPAIFIGGAIANLFGLVDISNVNGSLGQFAPISAQQITETIPNGAMAVYMPDGIYHSGSDPVGAFDSYQLDLGGPDQAISDLVAYAFPENMDGGRGEVLDDTGNPAGAKWVFFGQCAAGVTGSSDCTKDRATELTPSVDPDSHRPLTTGEGGPEEFHESYYPFIAPMYTGAKAQDVDFAQQPHSALQAQTISIVAKTIDIDSQITAGRPVDYTITINDLTGAVPAGSKGLVDLPAEYWSTNQPALAGTTPQVQYDATNNRVVINDVNASGGSSVSLDGGIISTNTLGHITVNDGYGNVTINNNSGLPVAVGNVSTGDNPQGEVRITDTFKHFTVGGQDIAQTHWYVNTEGDKLRVYDNSNGSATLGGAHLVKAVANDTTLEYDPDTGLGYQWTQHTDLARPIQYLYDGTPWSYVDADGRAVSKPVWTLDSEGVTDDRVPNRDAFTQVVTGATAAPGDLAPGATAQYGVLMDDPNNPGRKLSVLNVYYHHCDGNDCRLHFEHTTDNDIVGGSSNGAGVYEYVFPTTARLTTTTTVRADYPIAINFVGNATGSVVIHSNNTVVLDGSITNPTGATSIDATRTAGADIQAASNGSITTRDLTLNASTGIGGILDGSPLTVAMTGGVLNATAGAAGINIRANSAVNVGTIQAGTTEAWGNVTLSATSDILAAKADVPAIVGNNLDITSTAGAVKGASGSLVLAAHSATMPDGSTVGGVVNVSASGDVTIKQSQAAGDLRVGSIDSTQGAVIVTAKGGSIVAANGQTSADVLSQDQLDQIKADLHLTDNQANREAIENNTVPALEHGVDASYTRYWQLLNDGTVSDGTYTVASDKIALYRPLVSAAEGKAVTDDDVRAYLADQYTSLRAYLVDPRNVDPSAVSADYLTTYDPAFSYTATAAQVAALTQNAFFTDQQLRVAVNAGALDQPDQSVVGQGTPNISGNKNVYLIAGGNVGAMAPQMFISVADLTSGNVSDVEAKALAVAVAPGDVTVVKDASGHVTGVNVRQMSPLFVSAGGPVYVSSMPTTNGSVYLQANGNLDVSSVIADQSARLVASGNITSENDRAVTLNRGGLTLQAGANGSIGSKDNPFGYRIGGALSSAVAGQDVYLRATDYDLLFDQVVAVNGDVGLSAQYGSILATSTDATPLAGHNIALDASGSIGVKDNPNAPLAVQLGTDGQLSGHADGDARLYSPVLGTALSVASFTTGGLLDITSQGDLSATSLGAGGNLNAASAGDATLGILQSGGTMGLSALGDITLTAATSNLADDTAADADIDITAGGSILGASVTDGSANITTAGSKGIRLTAGTGIGDPLIVDTAQVNATSDAGDINIVDLSDLDHGTLTASTGSVNLDVHGNATLDNVTSGDTMALSADGDITLASATSNLVDDAVADADIAIIAGGSILGTSASDGSANITTAGSKGIRLTAGTGIGGDDPLLVNTALVNATNDTGNINLQGAGGDLVFGQITAKAGDVTLDAPDGSILNPATRVPDDAVALSGRNLMLSARDDIGDVFMLNLQVGAGGVLNGHAGGDALLRSPVAGVALPVGSFTAGGALNVRSAGDVSASTLTAGNFLQVASNGNAHLDTLNSNGPLYLTSGGDLSAAALTSSDVMDLFAAGGITLGAATSTLADDSAVDADIVITAGGSILGASVPDGNANITTAGSKGISLNARTGIGGDDPLLVDTALVNATSDTGNITLRRVGGDLAFGQITANTGNVTLDAPDGSILTTLNPASVATTAAVSANNITLDARDDVGDRSNLSVRVGVGGMLNGEAGGDAYLSSPMGVALPIGSFTAGGMLSALAGGNLSATLLSGDGVYATSRGDITLGTLDSTTAGFMLVSGGDLVADTLKAHLGMRVTSLGNATIGQATSDGDITLNVSGDVTLTSATSNMLNDTYVPADIAITAGGSILGTSVADGSANITAVGAKGISLKAGTGIGDPLIVNAAGITAVSDTGDIHIIGLADVQHATVTATSGNLILDVHGAATVGTATSGGTMSLLTFGDLTFDQLISGDDLGMSAGDGDIVGAGSNTIAVQGDANLVASGGINFHAMDVGGAATLMAGGDIAFDSLSAGTRAELMAYGAILGTKITADGADLQGFGGVSLGTANVSSDFTVGSNHGISIVVSPTGIDPQVKMQATAFDGSPTSAMTWYIRNKQFLYLPDDWLTSNL